jgi:deoxyribodipyrimidine photolyase-related protein
MQHFKTRLHALLAHQPQNSRRWVFVAYDQLNDRLGPLTAPPSELGIILVESPGKAARRPYHKQKLGHVLGNLRQFALEQAARGVAVRHVVAPSYREALERLIPELGPLTMMEAAERELRVELEPLVLDGRLTLVPHTGWLTTPEDFARSQKRPPWKMEAFYQQVRRRTGILMDGKDPVGGAFNFDADNRKAWKPERGAPPAPTPPRFAPDEITREVRDLILERFADHPGTLDFEAIPTTRADADRLWAWAKAECMPHFGPFEDAMSTRSTGLFHTRVSALLNLHRLLPADLVHDVAALPIDLPSKEGFIRQILGWREYVRHVHAATDGFRKPPAPPCELTADGHAAPSELGADAPLPPSFWGHAPSGLRCLDTVVADVWREGYSHHITRLMVLSNLGTLLGVSPRELTDWFWVAYTDAYDWVVEPNVLGMGTYGVGGLMTTKPYVSGAAYIDRMSDYCGKCQFDPKSNCPVTSLYWDFLARHEALFRKNHRTAGAIAGLARRSPEQRLRDQEIANLTRDQLQQGKPCKTR